MNVPCDPSPQVTFSTSHHSRRPRSPLSSTLSKNPPTRTTYTHTHTYVSIIKNLPGYHRESKRGVQTGMIRLHSASISTRRPYHLPRSPVQYPLSGTIVKTRWGYVIGWVAEQDRTAQVPLQKDHQSPRQLISSEPKRHPLLCVQHRWSSCRPLPESGTLVLEGR